MKYAVATLGIAGACLLAYLLARQGWGEVTAVLENAGWAWTLVALFHFVPMAADARSWWRLYPEGERPAFWRLCWLRWIGESVNNLLPAAQVGGDIVRARLAALQGSRAPIATATVVVDLTSGVFTQAVFTLIGLALLMCIADGTGLVGPILAGILIAFVLFGAFYIVQRIGFFRLLGWVLNKAVGQNAFRAIAANGPAFDEAIQSVYRRRRDVAVSCVWTLTSWIIGSGEMWIALWILGSPVSWVEAIVLESLGQAIKGAMFLVPGALGVQEAGFIGIGSLLGIGPETSIALSLLKRAREFSLGIPGLIQWHWLEGRHWWRKR
jgi:putative membrane protein